MSFNKRREYLFIYSVKDANPNGDPLNANHPRYDAETGQVLVSDVRVKRTVRDHWLNKGELVFIDGEAKTMKTRVAELMKELKVEKGEDITGGCLDTRLFGVTFALGSDSFSWTGPVQFKWGRSMHKVKPELVQGTGAFVTKDGGEQRTFRNEYIVPYSLISVYGIANQNASITTGANDEDLNKLREGLWEGTQNLITRSKIGHIPRLLVEITYKEGFNGIAGAIDEKVSLLNNSGQKLTENEEYAIRKSQDYKIDIQRLCARLNEISGSVDSIKIYTDSESQIVGLDEMKKLLEGKIQINVR